MLICQVNLQVPVVLVVYGMEEHGSNIFVAGLKGHFPNDHTYYIIDTSDTCFIAYFLQVISVHFVMETLGSVIRLDGLDLCLELSQELGI